MTARTRQQPAGFAAPELFSAEEFTGTAIARMKAASLEERGSVYTKPEVVEFMLDLAGYSADKELWRWRMLEPSFGGGDFLFPIVRRLLKAARRDGRAWASLRGSILAVELHEATFLAAREQLLALLAEEGLPAPQAQTLADAWLVNGDFLLHPVAGGFDFIAGNPPYVRQELIPAELLAEYRRSYVTLYDRADLYVPFMERCLQLLLPGGRLSFICSDRWMKNRYGGPLRGMISRGYSLRYYVDMVGTDAFQSEVVAYPAITVIERGQRDGFARIAHRPEVSAESLQKLHAVMTGEPSGFNGTVTELHETPSGSDPWLLESDAQPSLALVRRLEREFPLLEEAGCTVGIGVATGADRIFTGRMEELDVEPERKLPLVMTRDIHDGSVKWRGLGVINPFEEDGSLADFRRYPKFAAWMEANRAVLMKRHCAQRGNGSWYRTIDRITPSLARQPKLLIPDIKGEANIVLENEGLYPHHNLYYIVSRDWPLPALQAVLLAGIARLFVRAYSTKMRGGCLRFQAQYLRRIRLPRWSDVPQKVREQLSAGQDEVMDAVQRLYRLSGEELQHLTD